MKGNTNLITTIVAVVAFMFLWDHFVVSRYAPPAPKKIAPQATPAEQAQPGQTAFKTEPVAPPARTEVPAALREEPESTVVLTGEEAEVTFGSRGARVTSWKVKENGHWVELVTQPPKDLVPGKKDQFVPKVFPLETYPDLNFSVASASEKEVVFTLDHPQGFRLTKTITLDSDPFLHTVSLAYTNQTDRELPIETAIGWGTGIDKQMSTVEVDPKQTQMVQTEMRAVGFQKEAMSWKPGFIRNKTINWLKTGGFEWAGVDNDHFLAVFIPKELIPSIHIVADKKTPAIIDLPMQLALKPGYTQEETYQLYVGPKKLDRLQQLGHNLDKAVDFGFFGIISKALLKGMNFFHGLTGNYGWSIIIVTICVQILFFPLTKKSLQHSVRMKEVQPQLKKLQAQFKGDPKRLQIETFNLYKKNGMKFMGMEGCFPMLIQIPIFFAFYRTLRVAYELRGAPWIFWIQDLAVADPYFVLPIIMGGGMMLQQKLTAVAVDPAQAKMMMIMPLLFTFMFLKLPAGLVLYWCVNSICTIVAQKILQWQKHHVPKTAAP